MNISEVTKIVLMLRLNLSQHEEFLPLKPNELKSLFMLVESLGYSSESLLSNELNNLTDLAQEKLGISSQRIKHLLSAGLSLSLKIDQWKKRGIWVRSFMDKEYPVILKIKHRESYPSLIFGVGELNTLNIGGIGIVGSRNANSRDLIYSEKAGIRSAEEGVKVISGGARGVDTSSMMACLNAGGTGLVILPAELGKTALSSDYRKFIIDSRLTLISMESPDSGWTAGRAMARNKFIYSMSKKVLVVSCNEMKGGTWNGAIECLNKNWTEIFVKTNTDKSSAIQALIERGAYKDSDLIISDAKNLNYDLSEMLVSEISILQGKSNGAVKSFLTKSNMSCLDYPKPKKESKKNNKEDLLSKQQALDL